MVKAQNRWRDYPETNVMWYNYIRPFTLSEGVMTMLKFLFLGVLFGFVIWLISRSNKQEARAARREAAKDGFLCKPGDRVRFDRLGDPSVVNRTIMFSVDGRQWLLAYLTGRQPGPSLLTSDSADSEVGVFVWGQIDTRSEHYSGRGDKLICHSVGYRLAWTGTASYLGLDFDRNPLSGNLNCVLYIGDDGSRIMRVSYNEGSSWETFQGRAISQAVIIEETP